ncbi:MAG: CCA tRNA nucleotidyltransferase [Peptostreptococcaceae bacterium]|nr:CCA tRNA nucleotidyltransferase [Peptostreptococcaceae bacterium]
MNLLKKLESRKLLFSILKKLSKSYEGLDGRIYLIGGVVRDLIISEEKISDLDILITLGYPLEYAEKLRNEGLTDHIRGERIYNTAKLIIEDQRKSFCIDINHTRTEQYAYPGSLPEIEWVDSLFFDVSRRDFSINTIAMSLNGDSFGEVLDYLNGIEDLGKKEIRVLHKDSFIDDPIRIFRLIRYMKRLGLTIEGHTKALLEDAVTDNLIANVSGDRIFDELVKCLSEDYSHLYFEAFEIYGIFKGFHFDTRALERFEKDPSFTAMKGYNSLDNILLKIMLLGSPVFFQYNMPKGYKRFLENHLNKSGEWKKRILLTSSDSELYAAASPIQDESIAAIAFSGVPGYKAYIQVKHYFSTLKHMKTHLTGKDLLSMGVEQGKQISIILGEILEKKIQGSIEDSLEAEIEFIEMKLGRNV